MPADSGTRPRPGRCGPVKTPPIDEFATQLRSGRYSSFLRAIRFGAFNTASSWGAFFVSGDPELNFGSTEGLNCDTTSKKGHIANVEKLIPRHAPLY